MVTFNHIRLPELDFDLVSDTTENGRTYLTPEGNRYKSITTVLSALSKEHIQEWRNRVGEEEANRVSGAASRRGTAVHNIFEKYILNELNEFKIKTMMPNIKELFIQLRPHIDSFVGNVYCVEQALYSDKMKVAGRVDLIAEWEGELAIIDFKTSTKEKQEENIQNYFMQCTAYSIMFEERTGTPINKIVVAIAVEESNSAQIFVRNKNNYTKPLMDLIES